MTFPSFESLFVGFFFPSVILESKENFHGVVSWFFIVVWMFLFALLIQRSVLDDVMVNQL